MRVCRPQKRPSDDVFVFRNLAEWPDGIKLEKEKEVVGLYVSAQPLDTYSRHLSWIQALTFHQAAKKPESSVICCGTLTSHKVITTKKGDKMAFAQFEDYQSKAEVVIFPKLFAQIEPLLGNHTVFIIKGTVDASSSSTAKLKAESFIPVDLLFEASYCQKIVLRLPESYDQAALQSIKTAIIPGATPLEMQFTENNKLMTLKTRHTIKLEHDLLVSLEKLNVQVRLQV